MRWFSWFRRSSPPSVSARQAPPSLYIPGRETVASGESHYAVPMDMQETNRLDLQHVAMRMHFGTDIFAPVQQPHDILDAASGTGRWAREVAAQFPEAHVVGMDITEPLAVSGQDQPPNYTFQRINVLEPLPFPDASFDYTHMRFMFSAMPKTKWVEVARELVRVTRPGGWIEMIEGSTIYNAGPAIDQMHAWANQFFKLRDIEPELAFQIGTFLQEAGATGVVTRHEHMAVGPAGGRVGQMLAMDMSTIYHEAMPALIMGLKLDQRLVETTIRQVDDEIFSGRLPCIVKITIAFGQRGA